MAFGDDGSVRGLSGAVAQPGTGGAARFAATDYGDRYQVATASGLEDEISGSVAEALAGHLGHGAAVDLGRIDSEATWCETLAQAWPARRSVIIQPADPMPMLSLEGLNWHDYLSTRSSQFRNQVKRKRRALERDHEVTLRRTSAPEEVERDVGILFSHSTIPVGASARATPP